MPTSGQTYFIVNKKSGTAFDLSGEDQRSLIGFGLHRGDNQKWQLVQHSDGWTLQNIYNKKYLDVDIPNTLKDGVRVVAVDTNNPRKWDIRRDDQFDGWRIVVHDNDPNTNLNVDLSDHGNANPRTPITLWGQWGGKHQVWEFQQA